MLACMSMGCGSEDVTQSSAFQVIQRAFVYTSDDFRGAVDVYSVNGANGQPQLMTSNVHNGAIGNLAADPFGRYLMVEDSDGVSCFLVHSQTGLLTQTSHASVPTTDTGYEVVVNRQGTRVYVPANGGVASLTLDRDQGLLAEVARLAVPGIDLFDGAVDATGRFAYFIGNSTVERFNVNPDGSLTHIQSLPLDTNSVAQSIVIDDANQNLYILDSDTDVAPAPRGKGFAARPKLAPKAVGTSQILRYAINADGTLTGPNITPLGAAPLLFTDLATRSNLLLVAEQSQNQTYSFRIDPSNGGLVASSSAVAGGGDELALVPLLPVAVSSSFFGETLSAQLVGQDGTITQVPGTPVTFPTQRDFVDIAALVTTGTQ